LNDLKEIIKKLLKFQYESLGYGNSKCRSCGSFNYVDYGDNDTPMTESPEECSKNCPWRMAREAIKESNG